MKKLTPTDYRSMPWKNGAGTTIEIAVFPDNTQLDDSQSDQFVWRVSRAQVVRDGGFSHFPGVDRSLALLGGEGMRLTVNGVIQQVDPVNNIAVFSGDSATQAELIHGPISDFNLMSRRSACTHQLSHWVGEATRQLPANVVLLYCAQGAGKLAGHHAIHELHEDETLQFTSAEAGNFILKSTANSIFYCVQINRVDH